MSIEDTLRKIIREEIRSALGEMTPLQGESIVDYETRTSEPVVDVQTELPVFEQDETITGASIMNNKELMAAIKAFCSGDGMPRKAKAVLENFYPEYSKFSRVEDDKCQEVYETVVKELS